MKLYNEYLNKSLPELGAWNWLREPSAVSINHNISVITTGSTLLPAYSFKKFSCSNGTFVTSNVDYFL